MAIFNVAALIAVGLGGVVWQDSAPKRSAESVLGFSCVAVSKAELGQVHPGLKMPGRQYVVVSTVSDQRLDGESPFGVGDIIVKIDGQQVDDIVELQKILEGLDLPSEVKIEFLDVTPGPRPKTKRETISVKAVRPDLPPQVPGNGELPRKASPTPPKAKAEFDKFKNQTSVKLPDQVLVDIKYAPPEFRVSFNAHFDGAKWTRRPHASLVIVSRDDHWRFMDVSRTLYLVIDDGKPEEIADPHYGSEIMRGENFCWEYMSWELSPQLLERLRTAKKVECKLSIVEFLMPPNLGAGLADFSKVLDDLAAESQAGESEQAK